MFECPAIEGNPPRLDQIPLREDGAPASDRYVQFLYKQSRQEPEENEQQQGTAHRMTDQTIREPVPVVPVTSSKTVIKPTSMDVLLGKGKQYVGHPGNAALERLIEQELCYFHENSSSFAKSCVILGVAQKVKDSGGRFLICDTKTKQWAEARTRAIQGAIGSRFRYRLHKTHTNKQPPLKSTVVAHSGSQEDRSQQQSEQQPSYNTTTIPPEESEQQCSYEEQKEIFQLQELKEQLQQQEQLRINLVKEHEQLQLRLQQEQQLRLQLQQDTETVDKINHLLHEQELVEQHMRLQVAEIQSRSHQLQRNGFLPRQLLWGDRQQQLEFESTLALLEAIRNHELSNYLKRQL